MVKELIRVLKKDHPLILTSQNRYVMSVSLLSQDVDYAYRVLSKEKPFFMRNSLDVYTLSPEEFTQLLEANGIRIERIVGKLFTMPLGLSDQEMTTESYSEDFFNRIMEVELELASRPDSVSLGSHLQAIGRKQLKS